MRKEGVLFVCLFLIVILGFGVVSAGLFDYKPFKNQPGITGGVITGYALSGAPAANCDACVGTANSYYWCDGKCHSVTMENPPTSYCSSETAIFVADRYTKCPSASPGPYNPNPTPTPSCANTANLCNSCTECTANHYYWNPTSKTCTSSYVSGSSNSASTCSTTPPVTTSNCRINSVRVTSATVSNGILNVDYEVNYYAPDHNDCNWDYRALRGLQMTTYLSYNYKRATSEITNAASDTIWPNDGKTSFSGTLSADIGPRAATEICDVTVKVYPVIDNSANSAGMKQGSRDVSGNLCSEPVCVDDKKLFQCNTNDGNVWYYDSCGNRDEIKQECLGDLICENGKCVNPPCTDTCASFGYVCGTHVICGSSKYCGACVYGQTCNTATGKCADSAKSYTELKNCADCINEPGTNYKWCSAMPTPSSGECFPSSSACGLVRTEITSASNCPTGVPVCGNGVRETGENCDDGDSSSGDGCSSSCNVESGWTCNTASPNICTRTSTTCSSSNPCPGPTLIGNLYCYNGDVAQRRLTYLCTNGNCVSSEGRSTITDCGTLGCEAVGSSSARCKTSSTPVCGNGVRETGENCDDGDSTSGNGCSSSCRVESGWTCNTASPNICTRTSTTCSSSNPCPGPTLIGNLYCYNGDVAQRRLTYLCTNGNCVSSEGRSTITDCGTLGCEPVGSNSARCRTGSTCVGDPTRCSTCEECTTNNYYWEPDYSTCTSYSVPGASRSPSSCVEDECIYDYTCQPPEVCEDGRCVDPTPTCSSLSDCRNYPGTTCVNGRCLLSVSPQPYCSSGNDCPYGTTTGICVSSSASSGGTGSCVSAGSLSTHNGVRCSDDGYSFDSSSSGVVARASYFSTGSSICAKGAVARNNAGIYYQSCENGGSSINNGVWPGNECDSNVGPGFTRDGSCLTGTSSDTACDINEVCRADGSSNHLFDCSTSGCSDGAVCDNRGGRDGWNGLCEGNICNTNDECVVDSNCPGVATCDGGICVDDPNTNCFPCTELGYPPIGGEGYVGNGGEYCIVDGQVDVSQCLRCTLDYQCPGVQVCDIETGMCVGSSADCVTDEDCADLGNGWYCSSTNVCEPYGVNYVPCWVVEGNTCVYYPNHMGACQPVINEYSTSAQCQAALNPNNPTCGNGVCSLAETSCPQDCIVGYRSSGGPPDPPIIPTFEEPSDDDSNSDIFSIPLPGIPTPGTISIGLAITGMAVAPTANSFCGDNVCTYDETTCSVDCPGSTTPPLTPVCGDRACNGGETCSSCPGDCGPCQTTPRCGDGYCNNGETCSSCSQDCGSCPSNARCGDGSCNGYETCSSCSQDCGSCNNNNNNNNNNGGPPPAPDIPQFGNDVVCGDGNCNGGETCTSCSQDCGACPSNSYCGDGSCNGAETCSNCPGDCGACDGPTGPPTPPTPPVPGTNPQSCTGTPPQPTICDNQIDNGKGFTSVTCNTNTAQWQQGPCVRSECNNGFEPGSNNDCVPEGTGGVVAPPTPPTPPIPNPQTCTGTPPGSQDCSSQIANGNGHTATTCNVQTGQWEVGPCVVSSCNAGFVPSTNNNACVVGTNPGNLNECYLLEGDYCIFASSNVLCAHTNAHPTLQMCEGAKGICNNGVLDEHEICDGGLISPTAAHLNCESFGFGFGPLTCNDVCRLDASGCNLDCYDEDDGLTLTEKGKVVFNGNEYYDTCDGEGNLLEQFCINVLTSEGLTVFGKAEKAFSCPGGTECFEGACVDKNTIPWFTNCDDESDCTNADETCVEGKCVKVADVAESNFCEENVCFFDVSYSNGVNFEYGDADYFITYMSSSNGKVKLKVAEIKDRAGVSGFAKIETKELSKGTVNHVMGLAIEVLDANLGSAKVKVLQFSCLNDEICLGNFECSGVKVCAAPGAFCIISEDCDTGERCNAGVCVGGNNQSQGTQEIEGLCKLKSGEVAYCSYNGKTYQVGRKLGCKFILSSSEITEEEFVLGALEKKEFSTGVSVRRDVNNCGSQYLSLRFGGESDVVDPEICPAVCVQMWGIKEIQCITTPCNPICEYNECGSGCGADGKTTFNTQAECQAAVLSGLGAFCGDNYCNGAETRSNCPEDCGAPSTDFCDYGCFEDNNCYPIGYRKSGKYCGPQNNFLNQRNSEEGVNTPCDNSFECSSNLCIDGGCVSGGFMERIFGVFRDLFSSS